MAVKIRLKRTGAKNSPSFRVVAADARSPRDGRFLEILGWYDPKIEGRNTKLNMERIDHWISQGAQVSDTVKSLIKNANKADASEPVDAVAPEKPVEAAAAEPVVEETVEAVAEESVEVATEEPVEVAVEEPVAAEADVEKPEA